MIEEEGELKRNREIGRKKTTGEGGEEVGCREMKTRSKIEIHTENKDDWVLRRTISLANGTVSAAVLSSFCVT